MSSTALKSGEGPGREQRGSRGACGTIGPLGSGASQLLGMSNPGKGANASQTTLSILLIGSGTDPIDFVSIEKLQEAK